MGWLATPVAAVEISKIPELDRFIQELANKHQLSADSLYSLFERVEIRQDIIDAITRPREGLPWHEYRKTFVTDESIRNGVKFWRANAQAIALASERYGVHPEILVSIIGVETRYGRLIGSYRVLDALTTLAFRYPQRAEFFRKELEEFLLLCLEMDIAPLSLKGSYAGAMGVPQFMPSSYRRWAVDFDGDGNRDLIKNVDDAIGSVGNYLKEHGWLRGEPIIEPARLEGTLYAWMENERFEPKLSLKRLRDFGVVPVNGIEVEQLATLVSLEGEAGPLYYLGYRNFYVITRYNRSKRYAMAVFELGAAIKKLYQEES